jgi:hypothetical protein
MDSGQDRDGDGPVGLSGNPASDDPAMPTAVDDRPASPAPPTCEVRDWPVFVNGHHKPGEFYSPADVAQIAANESNLQPYLVVYDTQAKGFRAYKKIPVHTDVWVYIPGKYCTKAWDDLNDTLSFFEIGDEVSLSTFAEPVNPGTPE